MLHQLLTLHRSDLIDRCRSKVAERAGPRVADAESPHGISRFIDLLIKTLQVEQTTMPMESRKVSGPSGGGMPVLSEIGSCAAQHGHELLDGGFTVDQVVHDYGDLCQAITDLAFERGESIEVDEFRTFNRCLDNAIAEAVTEFGYQRDLVALDERRSLHSRWGTLVNESGSILHTALLAFAAIKSGNVGISGSTGKILEGSLIRLRDLIDHSLTDVRATAGMLPRNHLTSVAGLIGEVVAAASLEAQRYQCEFTCTEVDPELAMDVDPEILFSAVESLLRNAFRSTRLHSEVSLNCYAAADRILIDVEDSCGGLPASETERMLLPFVPVGADKSGLGLGLTICRRSLETIGGRVSVRNIPGSGCVFTIDLPRYAFSEASA